MEEFISTRYPKVESLKTHYCSGDREFVERANEWFSAKVGEYSVSKVYLPAGETPKLLYKSWCEKRPKFLEDVTLLQIDEVLSEKKPHLFEQFFMQQLSIDNVKVIPPDQSKGMQADLAVLGLGTNGHLAFHEPSITREFFFGEVELESATKQNLGLELAAKGLTYGLKAFLQTKAVLLLVRGDGKEKVYRDFLEKRGGATVNGLLGHPDLTVIAMDSFRAQH